MANRRPFGLLDFVLLLAVLAGSAGLRAGYLLVYADNGSAPGPVLVQAPPRALRDLPAGTEILGKKDPTELDSLIAHLKESNAYSTRAPFSAGEEQTADYSPGYPWLVGLLARVVPEDSLVRMVRWIQVGLGALTAGLYFLFARRAFDSRVVALLTGAFTAIYPFWIINTADLNDGVLASFLLALAVYFGVRAVQDNGPFASLLYGLTLAGLALVRAATLPYAFVALGWFLFRSRTVARGWLCALLAFLGFVNGLAPWTVRNFQLYQEPVPVVDSTWLHLWIGNNEYATGGPEDEAMLESAPADDLRGIKNQARRYGRLGTPVLEEINRQPVKTLQRRIQAGLYFLWGERFFTEHQLAEPTTSGEDISAWELPLTASLLILFGLAFLGWRWTYGWRKECVPASLAVIWLPLPYILGHAGSEWSPAAPGRGAAVLRGLRPGLPAARHRRQAAGRLEARDRRRTGLRTSRFRQPLAA